MSATFRLFLAALLLTGACTPSSKDLSLYDLQQRIENDFRSTQGSFAIAFKDLDNPANTVYINETEIFHAASTMKTPVMIELFRQAREGKFSLTDSIAVKNEFRSIVDSSLYAMEIGDDSGESLYTMIGRNTTISSLMYDMITVSSNLATNILIQVAGAPNVMTTMKSFGANDIQVLRGVEDQKAYDLGMNNTTTAKDLAIIMEKIALNEAGTPEDCVEMVRILKDQQFNDLIPLYLPEVVEVAHKTGWITGVHHDSAIVYLPDGRRYVLVLLSKNMDDMEKGTEMLARVSERVYQFMTQQ